MSDRVSFDPLKEAGCRLIALLHTMTRGSQFDMQWQFRADHCTSDRDLQTPKGKGQCGGRHAMKYHEPQDNSTSRPSPKGEEAKARVSIRLRLQKRLSNGSRARDTPAWQRKWASFLSRTQKSSTWHLSSVNLARSASTCTAP